MLVQRRSNPRMRKLQQGRPSRSKKQRRLAVDLPAYGPGTEDPFDWPWHLRRHSGYVPFEIGTRCFRRSRSYVRLFPMRVCSPALIELVQVADPHCLLFVI